MLGLGPLIGKRTWGGVIGIDPLWPLVDGTFTTQPEFSSWFNDVGWGVRKLRNGTDDRRRLHTTGLHYAGRDPQLERAIDEALRVAEEHTIPTPAPKPRLRIADTQRQPNKLRVRWRDQR